MWDDYKTYFSNNPHRDGFVYLLLISVTVFYSVLCVFVDLFRPECVDGRDQPQHYPNPEFNQVDCLDRRYVELAWLSVRECYFGRRCLAAIAAGSLIGYERRSPDRPAGIRTMAVTALGSCTFTIASMFAFRGSTMAWDASRVSAAIPSGVGFLGSGLIWKGMIGQGEEQVHQVHGLTTAASIWLSAAVGVVIGGGMYFVGFFTVITAMLILRFGPRSSEEEDKENENNEEEAEKDVPSTNLNDDYRSVPDSEVHIHEPASRPSSVCSYPVASTSTGGGIGSMSQPLIRRSNSMHKPSRKTLSVMRSHF